MSKPLYVKTELTRLRGHDREIENFKKRLPNNSVHLNAAWSSSLPAAPALDNAVWRVPYVKGVSQSFTVLRGLIRLETVGTTATTVVIQFSPGSGAFSATTLCTVSAASGAWESDTVGSFGPVTSGQLIRLNFTAIGTGAVGYTVQLEGVMV